MFVYCLTSSPFSLVSWVCCSVPTLPRPVCVCPPGFWLQHPVPLKYIEQPVQSQVLLQFPSFDSTNSSLQFQVLQVRALKRGKISLGRMNLYTTVMISLSYLKTTNPSVTIGPSLKYIKLKYKSPGSTWRTSSQLKCFIEQQMRNLRKKSPRTPHPAHVGVSLTVSLSALFSCKHFHFFILRGCKAAERRRRTI